MFANSRLSFVVLSLLLAASCSTPEPQPSPAALLPGPILEGRVVDLEGRPVANVEIRLAAGIATRWQVGGTMTDVNGFYRFAPLDVGSRIQDTSGRWDWFVGMRISHPAFVSADGEWWWDVTVPDVPGEVTRRDFTVRPAGVLTGEVHDEHGNPWGLALRLQGVGHKHFRWVQAGDDGRFREAGLYPGAYEIEVNEGNLDYPVIGTARIVAGEETHVALTFSRLTIETTPTWRPVAFASRVFADGAVDGGAFSLDGATYYFSRPPSRGDTMAGIYVTRFVEGRWSAAERVLLGGPRPDRHPALSPDGRRMVFSSRRPFPGAGDGIAHLWYVDRTGDGWGEPVPMRAASSPTADDEAPAFGPDGIVTFRRCPPGGAARPLMTVWRDGAYDSARPFAAVARWQGWREDLDVRGGVLSPDGKWIVLTVAERAADDTWGPPDLWTSDFADGAWTEPRPVEAVVNTSAAEAVPYFGPRGVQLFFVRGDREVFRVSRRRALR